MNFLVLIISTLVFFRRKPNLGIRINALFDYTYKKFLLLIFLSYSSSITNCFAQNYVTNINQPTSNGDYAPFSYGGSNKSQINYLPGDFSPSPISGLVNKIYFRFTTSHPSTYSDFSIRIAQVSDSFYIRKTFYSEPSQIVYGPASLLISPTNNTWFAIDLANAFYFDSSKPISVIIEYKTFSDSGERVSYELKGDQTLKNMLIGAYGALNPYGYESARVDIGFDITPRPSNNAGITEIESPIYFCAADSPQNIIIKIGNHGNNVLDSVKIGWSFDDKIQVPIICKHPILVGHDTDIILGSEILHPAVSHILRAWTYNPNGVQDLFPYDDTLFINDIHPNGSTIKMSFVGNSYVDINVTDSAQTMGYSDLGVMVTSDHPPVYQTKGGSFFSIFPNGKNLNKVGTYQIIYYAIDGCGTKDSIIKTFNLSENIPPVIALKGSQLVSICRWTDYKDSGYIVSDNYNKPPDIKIDTFGTFITDGGTTAPGTYYLRYKATDQSGNFAYSDSRTIYVIPDSEGICKSGILGLYSIENNISIYPNPGSGIFTITFQGALQNEIKINILNSLGQNVYFDENFLLDNGSRTININKYNPGIYFLSLKLGNEIITRKLVLQK